MTPELARHIKEVAKLLRERGATEVYLFGSVLHGDLRADSDIDIAVCGLPPSLFFRAMADASQIMGRDVDLVDLESDDDSIRSLRLSGDLRSA